MLNQNHHSMFLLQIEIATTLHKVHKVGMEQIAILTPYSAQKNLIDKKTKQAKLKIKVASITESQGKENHGCSNVFMEQFCIISCR